MIANPSTYACHSRRARALAVLVLGATVFWSAPAHAGLGDCSQPVSAGTKPFTSDCLRILRVAVGTATCTPACICAPKGTLPTSTSDALLCLRKAVGQNVLLQCPCVSLEGDDFNDNSKDPALWSEDVNDGNGVLTETSQVLRYSVSSGTSEDYAARRWIAGRMPYATDWEVQIDLANTTSLSADDDFNSFGISIFDDSNFNNEVFAELYNSQFGGPPARRGFYAALYDEDAFVDEVDSLGIDGLTAGALRIVFDAGTKVLTLYYDVNPGNGYQWVEFGSFGVNGSGGDDGNADWDFTDADRFLVSVYGFSELVTIAPGAMYGDNFQVTGAVLP